MYVLTEKFIWFVIAWFWSCSANSDLVMAAVWWFALTFIFYFCGCPLFGYIVVVVKTSPSWSWAKSDLLVAGWWLWFRFRCFDVWCLDVLVKTSPSWSDLVGVTLAGWWAMRNWEEVTGGHLRPNPPTSNGQIWNRRQ